MILYKLTHHNVKVYYKLLFFSQDIKVRRPIDEVTKEEGGWKQFPGDTVNVMQVVQSPGIEVGPLQDSVPVAEPSFSLDGLLQRHEAVSGTAVILRGEGPG